jgi:predicted alpha/beta hydrolase family esterase
VRVFLIHGMGRSRASMLLLSSRLKRAGHRPSTFGYFVRLESIEAIIDHWVAHIEAVLAQDQAEGAEAPYAILGHSLGAILTRAAAPRLPPGLCRFIMLAPPNQPPALARRLKENALYRALTGDAGRRLADPSFYESLPVPEVPTLIVAGDAGGRGRFLPFRGGPGDGVVGVEETRLGEHPHLVVDAIHTFIMNHRDATRTICRFLDEGRLTQGPKTHGPNAPLAA